MRFLFLILLIASLQVTCQEVHTPVSSSYTGPGAYSNYQYDIFSLTSNIASIARVNETSVGVFYENRYLLSETNYYSGVFVLPTQVGNFVLNTDYFGFKNFNESKIGIGYGKAFGKQLELGIKFNFYHFNIPKYVSASTLFGEIGVIYHLSEQLTGGIEIYNPVGGNFKYHLQSKVGSIYKFGIGYETSDQFLINSELIKDQGNPPDLRFALQYNISKQFFFRCGTSYSFNDSFAGAGLAWDKYRLDVSTAFHSSLGLSPGIMFIMNFNKPERP